MGSPNPYIHGTDATTIVSLASNKDDVAEWRSLSISSFIDESFSI